MQRQGIRNGYSFMEHGGMWADVFIISPLIAYVVTNYDLPYISWWSAIAFCIAAIAIVAAGMQYSKNSIEIPEAHAHGGKTTAAGWIHGLYAVISFWILILFYETAVISPKTLFVLACILSVFLCIGFMGFSPRWSFKTVKTGEKMQLAIEIIVVWIVTALKLYF